MTNIIAIWLAAVILGFLALDYFVLDWNAPVYLGAKFLDLLRYVAFWR